MSDTLALLERAHAHLTELRDKARGGAWEAYAVPAARHKAGYVAVAADDQEIVVMRYEGGYFDADLIVTLHRTIDAQLAVIGLAIAYGELPPGRGRRFSERAADLARAILNEGNTDD